MKLEIGNKVKSPNGTIYKIVGLKPGGKVELFVQETFCFTDKRHCEVRTWSAA